MSLAMLIMAFSMFATSCASNNNPGGDGSNTGNDSEIGTDGGDSGSEESTGGNQTKEDVYEDYVADKQPGGDQFNYVGNYAAPELTIDGKGDDAQWQSITQPLATFGHGNAATVKAYRGTDALFFLFEVSDNILMTEGNANDDSVTRSDSIEFYLDTLADGGLKPQSDDYQINLGIHGKTRIMQGSGSGWGNWNGLIDYEVSLNGTLNDGTEATDTGYSVEVMIPYTQINIEKDDTIAVSFGQVDKFNVGASSGTDWDWYGWTYGYLREPQTPDNYVLLDKDNVLMDRDAQEKPDADMAGYVLDSLTQEAVAGATVSVTIGEEVKTALTDEQGYFIFEKVSSDATYTVTVTKDGYVGNSATYTRAELRASDGGRVLKDILIKNEANIDKTTVTGTVKNVVYGTVDNATVRIDGTLLETTANENGVFEIANVPVEEAKDITLVVSASGYGESKTTIERDALTVNGTTAVGDVNINLPYAETGGFGNKNANFADSTMQISRTLTGVEFLLSGTRQLSGHIELYLDTKECASHRDKEYNAWLFNLNDTGDITGTHYLGGEFTTVGLDYDLYYNTSSGYSARLFIPYSYLDITPLEVFGISLGQWSTSASDWDGWGFAGQFVAPETPETFIRVSAINGLYRQSDNTSMVTLSGKASRQGVRVAVGSTSTTTGADGGWTMKVPASSEAMQIVYSCQGYVTKTTDIAAGYFDTHYSYYDNVTLELQKVTVSGTVKDSDTGAAISGATVTIAGTAITATTNEKGEYILNDVSTLTDIVLQFSASDYATSEITKTAVELAAADSHTVDAALISTNRVQYVTATGTVTNVNGPVAGAKVTVEGNSALTATTDENGRFVIENFAGIDCKVIIEKDGYITKTLSFSASSLDSKSDSYDFGETDMWLNYAKMQGLIADKATTFGSFTGYVTRSAKGFEFKFVGKNAFAGRIELFVDTKTSAGDNARDTSDYLFNLNDDGTFTIVNWGEGTKNETAHADMVLTVLNKNTTPEVYFTLPYAFFGQVDANAGITATEVIGISVGQWSTSANDWDGWDNFNLIGANGAEFVKPEMPQDYVRIAADNTLYAKADNATVDFSSYQVHFGTGMMTTQTGSTEAGALGSAGLNADDMYGKVASRDANGVTFEVITTGNFGTNSTTGEKEMILIYFDTGSESMDGWNPDYLVKIASDGTVYGRASSAWWSASEADKIGTATITKENGVTKIVYTVSYTLLGIGQSDVFGFAMREASHNAGDHLLYDPWHDCYFEDETTGIDAAACTAFIRVAADGTLYRATSNNV